MLTLFEVYWLDLPPTQDDITFLGSQIPTYKPSFATITSWVGGGLVDPILLELAPDRLSFRVPVYFQGLC